MLRPLVAVGLVVALSGCASEPRREFRGRRGGPPPNAEMRFARLFVSPSGEPFRGPDGLARWFSQADTDHDGTMTAAEFKADAVRFFKRLDANHDGVVDGFEIQAYERDFVPEIAENDFDRAPGAGQRLEGGPGGMGGGGRAGRRGGGMGRRGGGGMPAMDVAGPGRGAGREGAARYSLINEPEPVANADANVDGKVTLEEWMAATARRFAALDKARTGRLTLDLLKGKVPPSPTPPAR